MPPQPFSVHFSALSSSTSTPQQIAAMTAANTTAPELNNRALSLSQRGEHTGAIALHLQALEIKSRAYGVQSIQVGITLNALGEEYLEVGQLDDAEAALRPARAAREAVPGQEFDAAVTRENLGRVYERKADWEAARRVRADGAEFVACSNYKTFAYSKMKRCSACQAPVYCGATCQKADWTARHKVLCKARTEAAAAA